MSVDYCHKHHRYFDTDYECECKYCVDEEIEREELKILIMKRHGINI